MITWILCVGCMSTDLKAVLLMPKMGIMLLYNGCTRIDLKDAPRLPWMVQLQTTIYTSYDGFTRIELKVALKMRWKALLIMVT